jgi:hypothetical protein
MIGCQPMVPMQNGACPGRSLLCCSLRWAFRSTQVSERIVLAQKAYILFYIRDEKDGASWSAPPASPPTPQHSPRGMANVRSASVVWLQLREV